MAEDYVEIAGNDFCAKYRLRITSNVEEERSVQVVYWYEIMMAALSNVAM
jgi:hypothetical protein